ncbi:unnamed protein product [Clonostachys byssicola]|uniref:Uncharacterized protein n=1 Tax=Clonostachys byssicola TaxID=160290 RepID=A0A9N9UAD5_9HYPO|nr:unnamed protein product [Clonostachys byssicola]
MDWSWGTDLSNELQTGSHLYEEYADLANKLFQQAIMFETRFFESSNGKTLGDTAKPGLDEL